MSTMWRIAVREWRDLGRDPGTLALAAAVLVLLALSVAAVVPRYRATEQWKAEAAATVRQQWLTQGERHPHSAAHFGIVAFRAEPATAMLEPGVSAEVGQVVPLVTHERAFPRHPAAADRTSAVRYAPASPAWLALTLLPFVVIVAGHRALSGERESGNLGVLLGTGVSSGTLVAGKVLAVAGVALCLCLAKAAIDLAALLIAGGAPPWGRWLGLEAVHAAYLGVWVCLAVGASARLKTSQRALMLLVAIWMVNTVVVPRVASSIGRLVVQEPSLSEFRAAIQRDITYLPDGRPWVETWSGRLIQETLQRFNVSRIEDLPVGYAGIMLKSSDAHYEDVFATHFAALDALHRRQASWHHLVSITGPLVSAGALGQAWAGTDLVHVQRFADDAEAYRREIVHRTNDIIERGSTGTGWDLKVGQAFWESLPPFAATPPSWSAVWSAHRVDAAVLGAWLGLAVWWCVSGVRRVSVG